MTRKNYVKLADALLSARCEARSREALATVDITISCVADALANDNPRFDRERFYRAAGHDGAGYETLRQTLRRGA